jgi:hypothetical protein
MKFSLHTTLRDIGDTINDFTSYADAIDVSALLDSVGFSGPDPVASGHVRIVDVIGGVSLQIDADGTAGRGAGRRAATLKGVTARQIVPARDLRF